MNAHVQQLLDQVRQLSDEERQTFIDALLENSSDQDESIDGPDEELEALIAERLRQIDSGEVVCTPWEVVRSRL